MSRTLRTRLAVGLVMASFTFLSAGMPGYILPAISQTLPELKKLNPQFVTEPGCPVEVTAANTELEMDPFGVPLAARHYIDYRNVSGQAVVAVKFRIGYVAADGKIHQPYLNAPDGHPIEPGGQASQKWRGDRVDPQTCAVKIRVLQVKMADGRIWESQKTAQTNAQQQEGFLPLQPESPGIEIAGTPVPLSDAGKAYTGFPERTTTGTVPFKSVQTPTPGFDPNAFGTPGSVPATQTATTPNYAGWGSTPASGSASGSGSFGSGPGSAGFQPAPNAASPAAAGFRSGPGSAGFQPAPNAASPAAAGSGSGPGGAGFQPAPTAAAPAAAPAGPDLTDPLAAFDKIMGNSSKPAPPPGAAPAAPATAPSAAAPAPSAAAPAPSAAAPAPSAAAPAPSAAAPIAPVTAAPAAAAPVAPATTPVAPATAPEGAPASAQPPIAPQSAAPASAAPASAAPASAAPVDAPTGGDSFGP